VIHTTLTVAHASAELRRLGIDVAPEAMRVALRGDRWAVHLPGERIAWFATTSEACARMARERRLLRVLETRCRFAVPRVLGENAEGSLDVRWMVPGIHDTVAAFHRVRRDPDAMRQVGSALGTMVAELHTQVTADDVAAWLPDRPEWPEARAWIRERLPLVIDDPSLHAAADHVIARYEEALDDTHESDRVLVHTDLGFHNVSLDLETLEVHGIFDWEAACWADRHLDFQYLVFDDDRFALLDAALASYEGAVGRRLSRARILLVNAACAISYLAFRAGVPADEPWCGRVLSEDLAWTRAAIARSSAAQAGSDPDGV
jgi:aminoglycoside phosphotransferase (APT) family kinase protein